MDLHWLPKLNMYIISTILIRLKMRRVGKMEKLKQQIEEVINNKIRPRTRVDGGDIKFESIEDGTVYIGAYADCSDCPCCETELALWIEKKLETELGLRIKVKIIKHVPYYKI